MILALALYSRTERLDWTSSFSEQSYSETLLLVSDKEKLRGARCCLVRAEAGSRPIGGYYNSCRFAHWSGISSPQGQGAVSGILIGKSGLIFTSLHILFCLLANEERSSNVRQSQCVRALVENENSAIEALLQFQWCCLSFPYWVW